MANTELYIPEREVQPTLDSSKASVGDLMDSQRGWGVVAAAFLGMFLSMGVLVAYSFGVLAPAMAEDLGFNPAQIPSIFLVFSLSCVVGGPVWGALTDRFGARPITMISSMLMAILFCTLTILPSNAAFVYAAFVAIGLLSSGTLPASYATVVVGWFDKRRGLALGVTMMGIGAGAAVVPPLSALLLAHFGWRSTYVFYGLVIALVCVPILMVFLKPNPSVALERGLSKELPRLEVVRLATQVPTTWVLVFFAFLMGVVLIGTVISFVPMLQAQGMTRTQAAGYQSILGIALIAGRFIIGGLIDRFFAPRVMMAVLCITIVGFVSLYYANSPAAYALSAAGVGLAVGAEIDFLGFLVSRYYPKAAFATLFAVLFAIHTLGAGFGASLVAWLTSAFGSYQPAFLVLSALTGLLALSTLLLPRYEQR